MTIEDQLKSIILERYKSVRAFVQEVGIPYTTLDSALKRGLLNAGIGTMTKVFNALDLDVESIQTGALKSKPIIQNSFNFTDTELELIKKYRGLDGHGKKMVNLVIEEESARMSVEKIVPLTENIIELDNYLTPVSAGTGEFAMYESPKEKIRVIENSYTRKSDYVVKVKGDSMEPRYYDGDMLLVKENGDVGFGDIGIFFVDGDLLVKQKGRNELISLNPEYPPIVYGVLDEQHMCEGKVIGVLDPEWIR